MTQLQLGLDTFGDGTVDAEDTLLSHARSIRNIVELAVLAGEVGVNRAPRARSDSTGARAIGAVAVPDSWWRPLDSAP